MAVIVIAEPAAFKNCEKEKCCLCNTPTSYWHPNKDVPLCQVCAKKVDESDVPTKREWIDMGTRGTRA